MRRREVLATAGGVVSTGLAGCTIEVDCQPGEDTLASVDQAIADGDPPESVAVQGALVRFVGFGVAIEDTTGFAEVTPTGLREINPEWFDEGDCVEVTGQVGSKSSILGMPYISIDEGEDIVAFGDADREIREIPSTPDANFVNADGFSGLDETHTVEIRHDGGEDVPASELLVSSLGGTIRNIDAHWHDLSDDHGPDDPVTEGDSVRITDLANEGDLILLWDYDESWRREFQRWQWNLG